MNVFVVRRENKSLHQMPSKLLRSCVRKKVKKTGNLMIAKKCPNLEFRQSFLAPFFYCSIKNPKSFIHARHIHSSLSPFLYPSDSRSLTLFPSPGVSVTIEFNSKVDWAKPFAKCHKRKFSFGFHQCFFFRTRRSKRIISCQVGTGDVTDFTVNCTDSRYH